MRLSAKSSNAVLLCVSLAASLAVVAGMIALLRPVLWLTMTGRAPTPEVKYRQRHQVYHHGLRPGSVARRLSRDSDGVVIPYRVNSRGMRDPERAVPKPAGVFRILMLGDSFIEGGEVVAGRTVSAVMEELLGSRGRSAVEVVNGGCSSYSPLLEFLFLRETGLQLEPDLVILNLDMSDVWDDMAYTKTTEFDASGVPVRTVARDADELFPPPGTLPLEQVVREQDIYDRYFPTRPGDFLPRERLLAHFDRTWDYIRLTAGLARSRHAGFMLTAYPMGHQVDAGEWDLGRAEYGFASRRYDGLLFDYLSERAGEDGIHFLSLLEGFRESQVHPLFARRDGHWNEAGHRLAAELIVGELERSGVLKNGPAGR